MQRELGSRAWQVRLQDAGGWEGAGAPSVWSSLLEAGWLLAAIVTPLAVNLWASQPFEPVKAVLLRSIVWLMAGMWLVSGLVERRDLGREASDHRLFWPALVVVAVQTLATLLATDRGLSLWGSYERAQGWLTLLSYGLLFLLVAARLRAPEQARRLAIALVVVAAPLAALGLAQALGWYPLPLLTDARSPVYATLGRSNFLGAYLAMLLPLTLALCVTGPRFQRVMAAGLLAAEIVGIALTEARGAWLAAGAAIAFWILAWFWPRLGAAGRRWQALAAGTAGLGLAGSLALALWMGSDGGSTAARLSIWRAVLPLIARRPLLGHGPEALGLVFPQVYPPELVYYEGRAAVIDRAHNLFLDWAVTTGAAGLLALGALLALFFAVCWKAAQRASDTGQRALLIGCMAAVSGNLVGNLVSFDVTATATASALLMALGVGLARMEGMGVRVERARTGSRRSLPRAAITAISLLVASGLGAVLWQYNLRPAAADMAALASNRRAAAGDWAGAIEMAERAAALWPREPAYFRAASWAWLGGVTQAGMEPTLGLERAEAALLAAQELRPGEVQTWAALGELYGLWGNGWDPGKLPLAHAAYEQATSLAPGYATLYTSWGMVDLEGGHFVEAADRFRRALDLDATDGYAFAHLGQAELAQGRVDEALVAFQQADHWQPELIAAQVGLARCLWLLDRRWEAERALEQALELDPDNAAGKALRREMGPSP